MQRLHFYDNKDAIDRLLSRDRGLFTTIDEASKNMLDYQYVINKIQQRSDSIYIKAVSSHEFTVAHYTGKLLYDASEIPEKNRDFVPPEMIETLRQSTVETVKEMFTNKLTKAGSLTVVIEAPKVAETTTTKGKWGALMQETSKPRVRLLNNICQFLSLGKRETKGAWSGAMERSNCGNCDYPRIIF